MKKSLLITLALAWAFTLARAQENPAFIPAPLFEKNSDSAWILESYNIHAYQVDLQPVREKHVKLKIYLDEYHGRDSVTNRLNQGFETRRSFPEGPVYQMERLRSMFRFKTDSTAFISLSIPDFFAFQLPVDLESVNNSGYFYNSRPFARTDFETGKKIPVVLYGSNWYDEQFDVYRFCGRKELPVDMNDEMFDLIPHYFIISLKVEEIPTKE